MNSGNIHGQPSLKMKSIDRISDLPDPIIHHILSFLPSTREAVRTGILSKRWHNQWTRVPVLIFNWTCMFPERFIRFVDTTLILHDCYKIKKFHLICNNYHLFKTHNAEFHARIRFAIRKHVQDLYLCLEHRIKLPEFLFDNAASLINLRIQFCKFMPNIGKVDWKNLKSLSISSCVCKLRNSPQHILSGTPLLESLELIDCDGLTQCVIASKSLKRLLLGIRDCTVFEISCPKLEELSLSRMHTKHRELFVQVIQNVLSTSSLLESLELASCVKFKRMVIASNSLKRLGLEDLVARFDIVISCPKLENLKLSGRLKVRTVKLLNVPSLLFAAIDSDCRHGQKKFREILQQLHHVKELRMGRKFIEFLSTTKVKGLFSPVLNIKSLTLDSLVLDKHYSGIAWLLDNLPKLENLVIDVTLLPQEKKYFGDFRKWKDCRESFQNLETTIFDCLILHLKTIKIIDFPEQDDRSKHVLELVQFLLNNARVLEKMVVVVKDVGIAFPLEVSKKVLSMPKCSRHAMIEFVKL